MDSRQPLFGLMDSVVDCQRPLFKLCCPLSLRLSSYWSRLWRPLKPGVPSMADIIRTIDTPRGPLLVTV